MKLFRVIAFAAALAAAGKICSDLEDFAQSPDATKAQTIAMAISEDRRNEIYKRITMWVYPETKRKLEALAAERNTSMTCVVENLIAAEWIERCNK